MADTLGARPDHDGDPRPPQPAGSRPYVDSTEPAGEVTGVTLVLHGGKAHGTDVPKATSLSMLRMKPFQKAVADAGREHGVASWLLHYRVRGWNDADPVRDARWALTEIRRRYGDVPVALIGHSMGGRTALRVADDPSVRGVCGLAPWLPGGEPIPDLTGRTIVLSHGDRDRWTDANGSLSYAARAKARFPDVARFTVAGVGHAMLRRAPEWHAFARNVALGVLGVEPLWPIVTNALHMPSPDGLAVPLQVPSRGAGATR